MSYAKVGKFAKRFKIEKDKYKENMLCNCYPEHCTCGKHKECWCSPDIISFDNGNKVIVHQDIN